MKLQTVLLSCVLLTSSCLSAAFAQLENTDSKSSPKPKTEVMVLGTFHFAQVEPRDEMLSETRQSEISELVKRLKEFNPEKIFVERNPEFEDTNKLSEKYQQYVRGDFELTANEIYQIGFRLGKELGHQEIYQADHPGMYGLYNNKVRQYARAHDQTDILEGNAPGTTLGLYATQDMEARRKSSSIIDYLRFLNGPEYQETDHGWYASTLPRIGDTVATKLEGEEKDYENEYFIGAEMLADWYRRNIKIYSKILTQMSFKEERILVIFGNGHSTILKHLFESNPQFNVVDTAQWFQSEQPNHAK